MIIDFHTHTFPDEIAPRAIPILKEKADIEPQFDGTIEGLKRIMKDSGVDISISLPVTTNKDKVESINNYSIKMNSINKEIIFFGSMHPDYIEYEKELDRIKKLGLKGIKIHPEFQETYIDDERYVKIIDYAFKIGLIVVTHSGVDPGFIGSDYSSVKRINNLLNKIKNRGTLVLAHMGGLMEWDQAINFKKDVNLYFDTAISIYDINFKPSRIGPMDNLLFYKFIEKFGSDHIIFGSDNPWMNPKHILDRLNTLNIQKEDLDNILYKNALKLLKKE